MPKNSRRGFLKHSGVVVGAGALAGCASRLTGSGGEYPSESFTLLNPYPPGGGTDVYFSQFVDQLEEMWDVSVQQEYESGGGSARAMQQLENTDSNHIVGWQDIPIQTILQFDLDDPGFDIREQVGICSVATLSVNIIVQSGSDYTNFEDLRSGYQNGEISTIGGIGTGSSWHWAIWQMKQNWGLDWSEYIGYEGGGPLSSAVLSGEIDAGIILATPIIDFVEQGDLEVVMTVGSESPSQFSEEVDTPDQFDLDATSVRAAGGELVLSVWGPPALTDQEQSTLESDFIDMMNSDPIQDWSEESGQTVEPESGSVVEETVQESFNLEEDYLEFQDSISG